MHNMGPIRKSQDKPKTYNVAINPLPPALRPLTKRKHWVIWKWTRERGDWTKPPYRVAEPDKNAATDDPTTWGTYKDAVAVVAAGKAEGIGFNLIGSGLVAFDLDHCRDPDSGAVDSWAQQLIDKGAQLGAYVEVTVSGTGFRIIGRGSKARTLRTFNLPVGKLELYRNCEKYITISGGQVGSCSKLPNLDAFFDATLKDLDGRKQENKTIKETSPSNVVNLFDNPFNASAVATVLDSHIGNIIKHGVAKGDRSDQFHFVVCSLLEQQGGLSWDCDEIVALLKQYPNEIASKYRKRLPWAVNYSFKRWQADQQNGEQPSGEQKSKADIVSLAPKPQPPKSEVILMRASDVVPRPKNWLWYGHLLRGAQELLTGLPGVGKSQVHCSYVASVTRCLPWPDGTPGPEKPGSVIMISAEDVIDQEIVPRLMAAGADLDRVHFLSCIRQSNDKKRQFLLAEDLEALERGMATIGDVMLITIDPITAYMGKVDSHKVTDVRSQLGPLKDFAERNDVAVSTITHPAKNAGSRAIDQFIGSQAFIAAGRIGHACFKEVDEEKQETGRILFCHAKHNPSIEMPTLAFRIEEKTVQPFITAPRVVWDTGTVDISADDALAAGAPAKRGDKPDEVVQFLGELLCANKKPIPVQEIMAAAAQRGFSEWQVKNAKEKLAVKSAKNDFGAGWTWQMPN